MSELIGIVGESGTGKSTAIRTLDSKETAIVNCVGKPLPFKGWKSKYKNFNPKGDKTGNYYSTDMSTDIIKFMNYISNNRPEIKHLVIDD